MPHVQREVPDIKSTVDADLALQLAKSARLVFSVLVQLHMTNDS